MSLLPVELPEPNKPVKAVIRKELQEGEWEAITAILVAVEQEDGDCDWRFLGGSELSFTADVVYWEYYSDDVVPILRITHPEWDSELIMGNYNGVIGAAELLLGSNADKSLLRYQEDVMSRKDFENLAEFKG